jgi:hypothetical protein
MALFGDRRLREINPRRYMERMMAKDPRTMTMSLTAFPPGTISRLQINKRVVRYFRDTQQPNNAVQLKPSVEIASLTDMDSLTLWNSLNKAAQDKAPNFSESLFHHLPIPFVFVRDAKTVGKLTSFYVLVYRHNKWKVT